ncbi:MAG: phospholipase D-like domain-containing protein [Archaeoglobaceae archaeon]|nr:phospholipase D-like domain-containing protein [Archaeoglobaceae archaeon]MDW8117854.1 phospholipase D-like domain-containing protein [Archaeoglobaceae archaeon]
MNYLVILSLALLLEICPNPYGDDNAEYLKVYCPDSCILRDNRAELPLKSGIYTIAKNMSAFLGKFKPIGELIEFPKNFALSNGGEEICITSENKTECFYYGKDLKMLDDGLIYFRDRNGDWDFRYEDWSNFSCFSERIKGKLIITPADFKADGFRIASYNFFADFQPEELFVDAKAGIRCGVDANRLSGSYRHFHYKFGVKGDKVIITTENWIFSKKGYIVEFESNSFANALNSLLDYDRRFLIQNKSCSGNAVSKSLEKGKSLEFEANATLLILPDCNPVIDFIESANKRLYIIAPYMGFDWFDDKGLLYAIRKAKENGAKVKIVLSKEYSEDEANILQNEGFEVKKISNLHGKVIVADDRVLITSANMNMNGLKLNREIGIVLESSEVAEFIISDLEEKGIDFIGIIIPIIIFVFAVYLSWRYKL